MELSYYRQVLELITFGKRLPEALYIVRPIEGAVPAPVWELVRRAEVAAEPDSGWNLLKLHLDQVAITFLSYPNFDSDPHPSLAEATKINLNSGSVVRTDYRARANPPILHRKETFLPPTDSRYQLFAELTRAEEAAGLMRDGSRIGLRLFWESLLLRMQLGYKGHKLISRKINAANSDEEVEVNISRHRTAIKRYDLSKPVKILLERGLLQKKDTFFDYGCGHGMDIDALQSLGYEAAGWDPAFRPTAEKKRAAVVNLGYVLNVIENPSERVDALRNAFSLTERLLIVSTFAAGQETEAHSRPFRDGFLTKANTFQKFFAPGELETLIEQTLNTEVITLGLGMCVAFRDADDAELFEAGRNRRRIDWHQITSQFKFSTPSSRERRNVDRYALNKDLLDSFWARLLDLGRLPEAAEFEDFSAVTKAAGGIQRAFQLVIEHHGEDVWNIARKARSEDVLVYLAMTAFRPRFLQREIPLRIKHDIRSFFGDVGKAQALARDLLYAAGDYGEIALACEEVKDGLQDHDALTIHRDLFERLPALLRIYVLCAARRYGDPAQADLIKIHKASGKVTFQHYDDFDGQALPTLRSRIKVNLRNLFVEVFDHSVGPKLQLLYFKERFVAKNHPKRLEMEKFSTKLRKLGLEESTIGFGPDKATFEAMIKDAGLNFALNRVRSASR
jgi:DNA phosphorothioation-associated putative methyltransferase